jgi:nitrite reductase/ring-hydroxylating ferredoxin subunit
VETPSGRIRARHVVVATQLPFLDRGLHFARAHPLKSYAVSAPVDEAAAPRGLYLSVDEPTRSLRSAPGSEGARHLVVGGESGRPGGEEDTEVRFLALEAFAREHFGAEAELRWSAHDYVPVDGLPYIGPIRYGEERVHVATGFAKWGLTKGMIAARLVADAIAGRPSRGASLYDARRLSPRASAAGLATENARVARRFVGDRLRRRPELEEVDAIAPGQGALVRAGGRQLAVYRDEEGVEHVLSARCPHLGCIVGWSEADRGWACPCHGSRFTGEGELLQGPATEGLSREPLSP